MNLQLWCALLLLSLSGCAAATKEETCAYRITFDADAYRHSSVGLNDFSKFGHELIDDYVDGKIPFPPIAQDGFIAFLEYCDSPTGTKRLPVTLPRPPYSYDLEEISVAQFYAIAEQ